MSKLLNTQIDLSNYKNGLSCSNLYTQESDSIPPFGSQVLSILQGKVSDEHSHHDGEVFHIISGQGVLSLGNNVINVKQGDHLFIPPFEFHRLENTGEIELLYTATWWSNENFIIPSLYNTSNTKKTTLITATPPTPNGNLHLGHYSGPYVASDIHRRYLAAQGQNSAVISWADDHQSYVKTKSIELNKPPQQVAIEYCNSIVDSLDKGNIIIDGFATVNDDLDYIKFVQDFFKKINEKGYFFEKETSQLYCHQCEDFVSEAFVVGCCPHCDKPSDGNACEACGLPNDVTELTNATCSVHGCDLESKPRFCHYFSLEKFRTPLVSFVKKTEMSPRLTKMCETLLSKPLPDIAVGQTTDWGISLPFLQGNQRLYVWMEMAAGYVYKSSKVFTEKDMSFSWENVWKNNNTEVIQYFGIDNGYFHAILIPAILMAWDEKINLPTAFIVNEFLLLEGEKFSTSRNHAIWAIDLLNEIEADPIRYYLSKIRPEGMQTNFDSVHFSADINKTFFGDLLTWINEVNDICERKEINNVLEPGSWLGCHKSFYSALDRALQSAKHSFIEHSISQVELVNAVESIVKTGLKHLVDMESFLDDKYMYNYLRTSIALQHAAIKLWSTISWPLIPDTASLIANFVDEKQPSLCTNWPQSPLFIEIGASLNLGTIDLFPKFQVYAGKIDEIR